MFPSPLIRFFVKSLDICVELLAIHAPDTSSADLHGRQFPRPDQRVDLRNTDIQIRGHVLIVLMSAGLVIAIWGIAEGRLVDIFSNALDTVCGGIGC